MLNSIVTFLKNENDDDLSLTDISLREAILYSNSSDTISFDDSLRDETIVLTLGELASDKSLKIQGFADSELTIDGNNNNSVISNNTDSQTFKAIAVTYS